MAASKGLSWRQRLRQPDYAKQIPLNRPPCGLAEWYFSPNIRKIHHPEPLPKAKTLLLSAI
jgi:hypothetical protein